MKAAVANWFSQEVSISRHLPYRCHVAPNIVKLDDGSLMTAFSLAGVAHETASDYDLIQWHKALCKTLQSIADPDVSIWDTLNHYLIRDFADGTFEPGFASDLNEAYRLRCAKEKLFANDLYCALVLRGPGSLDKMFSRKAKGKDAYSEVLDQRIERINLIAHRLSASLERYKPRRLGVRRNKGVIFSETLEYLALIANGSPTAVPLTNHLASDVICRARHTFGTDTFVRDFGGRREYGAILSVFAYPKKTEPGDFAKTLSLGFPFIMTNSFSFISKQAAQEAISLQARRMVASGDAAADEIAAFPRLQARLQSRDVSLGRHDMHICVTADSAAQLQTRVAEAEENCVDNGYTMTREDSALQAALYAQFPGNEKYRPRRAPITSDNYAGLIAFYNYPTGRREGNQWGPATTMLLTEAGTPFFIALHDMRRSKTKGGAEADDDKAPGNTLILGPTGGGKTTLQTFLVAQSDKARPTVFTFDKSRGQEIFVRGSGGVYSILQTGRPTGFNFLKLPPTAQNIAFARSMVTQLASGGDPLPPDTQQRINDRVEYVMLEEPYDSRHLTHLRSSLDTRDDSTKRLGEWCEGGQHQWAFPSGDDAIDFSGSRYFGFDSTDFLENDAVRVPIMKYLFHRVDTYLGTRPVIINIDELKSYLRDDYFTTWVEKQLLLIRKKDAIAILGTQQVSHVLESKIASALVEQTQSKFLLPNPQGKYKDYVDGLGLSQQEFELLAYELPETNPRAFLFKQPGVSAVCNLNLAGMNRELNVLSGTDFLNSKMELARKIAGENPANWLPVYHEMLRKN
ncbi:hypothetical protein J7369_14260 [Xanthomonas phaseoli pv. dieffenbachiae]|uniref:VirB4 family type IV secretion/conjugal transfer ATPase n=1 Tax=Xanthomonas phaseoli TaxID=1985254 RepID=UPI001ADA9766|nr:hypothetical protein [Xanthomonas phaseoli]MBO9898850.1 hypothetical protein [Xanthomonas phaseoli pv. dieffenbachiae]